MTSNAGVIVYVIFGKEYRVYYLLSSRAYVIDYVVSDHSVANKMIKEKKKNDSKYNVQVR